LMVQNCSTKLWDIIMIYPSVLGLKVSEQNSLFCNHIFNWLKMISGFPWGSWTGNPMVRFLFLPSSYLFLNIF
jgi:hypothetical protein